MSPPKGGSLSSPGFCRCPIGEQIDGGGGGNQKRCRGHPAHRPLIVGGCLALAVHRAEMSVELKGEKSELGASSSPFWGLNCWCQGVSVGKALLSLSRGCVVWWDLPLRRKNLRELHTE